MSDETIDPPMDETSASDLARSIYADFAIWKSKTKPKWHPVKKMRYIFFRMIDGQTIQDAIKEIRWTSSEFWHLVDLKRNAPFRDEYKRAKQLQGRAIADTLQLIAEGRDKQSKKTIAAQKKLIKRALRRALKQKSGTAARAVVQGLLAQLNENDNRIIARNKLQMDAAKWLAKSANPVEYGDKAAVALSGALPDEGSGPATPISIQFVAPDGSVMSPMEAIKLTNAQESS